MTLHPEMTGEIEHLLDAARRWAGAPMAIATVLSTWGSAPRPRGSHMLVHRDGRFEGSVSGGCVEGEVLVAAADCIASGRSQRLTFDVDDQSAWAVSLPCGGAIDVLVQPVAPGGFDPALFGAIADARARGAVLTVSTDLASGESRTGSDHMAFVNSYLPPRRLLIVGAVQIAQPLAALVRAIDIMPVVIDPRARFLTVDRFPGVALDDRWPDDAIRARRPDPATAIVTLSHDPKIDDPALIAALETPAYYIAALGSRRSHATRLERLRASGIADAALTRIEGPAGVAIGAIGASEIALSIAAGLVKAWRAGA